MTRISSSFGRGGLVVGTNHCKGINLISCLGSNRVCIRRCISLPEQGQISNMAKMMV